LTEAITRNPGRFEAQIVDLVAGFGGPEGLTLAGIEDHIALERAGARASAMRRFLAMDLDGDGAVTRAELVTVQRAASAATRGRMERQFLGADLDGSDTVDAAEIVADDAGRSAGGRAAAGSGKLTEKGRRRGEGKKHSDGRRRGVGGRTLSPLGNLCGIPRKT
jgi:hypothetical protein